MRHAGMGWSNGAISGGNSRILALPSPDLLILSSEHWHHDEAVRAGKRVLFRGMARQGFRPAEVGWDARRYVDEITRDAVRVSEPIQEFVAWNELNLNSERGDQWADDGDLNRLYELVGQFCLGVISELRRRPATKNALLHFGAWAPKDETDYTQHWHEAANRCDAVDVHAYGRGEGILGHISKYRALFPNKHIQLTEWHSDGAGPDEDRLTLELLARLAEREPRFRAYYFLWKWHNPPSHQRGLADAIAVEGNPDRLALFLDPPIAGTIDGGTTEPDPDLPEEPADPGQPDPGGTMPNPWRFFTAEQIAAATECPVENVEANWPKLTEQMAHCGIVDDQAVQIAMIGTVAKESASTFAPVREAFWLPDAERWAEYVRRNYGGGPNYHGRGLIQNTHLSNYRALGPKIAALWGTDPNQPDFDLVTNPDNLLQPDMSAAAAAIFFRDTRALASASWPAGYSLIDAAHANDDEWIRRLVYGGRDPDGEARLGRIRAALGGPVTIPGGTVVTYNRDEPPVPQNDPWSCAPTSTRWAMKALGRNPSERWMEDTMIAEGVVSTDLGLLDASGAGLADFIRRQYGEFGYTASNVPTTSFNGVVFEAGAYPLLIGGRVWNHWCGVRGYDTARDVLLLANPSDGWMDVSQEMPRAQFDALGPFSMVRVTHPDLAVVVPPEPPEPTDELAALRAENARLLTLLGYSRDDVGAAMEKEAATIRASLGALDAAISTLRAQKP